MDEEYRGRGLSVGLQPRVGRLEAARAPFRHAEARETHESRGIGSRRSEMTCALPEQPATPSSTSTGPSSPSIRGQRFCGNSVVEVCSVCPWPSPSPRWPWHWQPIDHPPVGVVLLRLDRDRWKDGGPLHHRAYQAASSVGRARRRVVISLRDALEGTGWYKSGVGNRPANARRRDDAGGNRSFIVPIYFTRIEARPKRRVPHMKRYSPLSQPTTTSFSIVTLRPKRPRVRGRYL